MYYLIVNSFSWDFLLFCKNLFFKVGVYPSNFFLFFLLSLNFNICHLNIKLKMDVDFVRLAQINNAYFVTHMWVLHLVPLCVCLWGSQYDTPNCKTSNQENNDDKSTTTIHILLILSISHNLLHLAN